MSSSTSNINGQWQEAFPGVARPQLYASDTEDENGFLPINDSESFSQDTTMMTAQQLHALSSNNQIALQAAQNEYLKLENLVRRLAGKDAKKNPQLPQSNQEFQGRQEAGLYGYKHVENKPIPRNHALDEATITETQKRDNQLYQEPFSQGGFIPTTRQYATKVAKADDPLNPDGWAPIKKDGKYLIPKVQQMYEEYPYKKAGAPEETIAARAGSADAENFLNGTPNRPVDKRLTRTRYDGSKVPLTRDVSEDPSRAPSPQTARAQTPKRQLTPHTAPEDGSPVPRKRQRLDNIDTDIAQSSRNTPAPPQSRPRARAGQATVPPHPLSPKSMRAWKWTNETILEAIQKDYLWLHPEPAKALINKDKLLAAANPVRTWSMCNKWIDWHEKGLDKRPRNKDGNTKRLDPRANPHLGLALAVGGSASAQGNMSRPVSRGSNQSNDQSSGYRKNRASDSRNSGIADSRPQSNIEGEPEEERLQRMADRQLLVETVEEEEVVGEEEEKDGEFLGKAEASPKPGTPARRSMRGKSQAVEN